MSIERIDTMNLSTRGRYGLRAILQLADAFHGGPVLMRTIAEDQGISLKYLHAILTILKGAGLVRSVRGAGGGYVLSRPPSRIKVSEVVEALEGSLSLVECVDHEKHCERAAYCAARDVWVKLSSVIQNTLSNLTLEDVIIKAQTRGIGAAMYHI